MNNLLKDGIVAQNAGDYKKAGLCYTKVLREEPNNACANHNLGKILGKLHSVERAMPFFKKALDQDPSNEEFWVSYIGALIRIDNIGMARILLEKARNRFVDSAPLEQLDTELNKNSSSNFPSDISNNTLINANFTKALEHAKRKIEQGAEIEARDIYRAILTKKPNCEEATQGLRALAEILVTRGAEFYRVNKLNHAIKAYKLALDIVPNFAEAYYNLGNVLRGTGDLDETIDCYRKALRAKPNFVEAYVNLGISLRDKGWLDDAIEAFEEALKIKPDFAEVYTNLGNALQDKGNVDAAIENFKKALKFKPENAYDYYNLGNALKDKGDLNGALNSFAQALKYLPDYPEAHNNMAIIFKLVGELDAALMHYQCAIKLRPDYADAIVNYLSLNVQIRDSEPSTFPDAFNNDFSNQTKISHNPKLLIYRAIESYITRNLKSVVVSLDAYLRVPKRERDMMSERDRHFCDAYFGFLTSLLPMAQFKIGAGCPKVFHLGESHCLSYSHQSFSIGGVEHSVESRITFGAKAFHFSQEKQNGYKFITERNLKALPEESNIFLSFGEIDCRIDEGFLSASLKLNRSIGELINETVKGYLAWFAERNIALGHHFHFFNVPAPTFQSQHGVEANNQVATTVYEFNSRLFDEVTRRGMKLIDVYTPTNNGEGFSNRIFHVDKVHLGPSIIPELEAQLT